MAISLSRQKTAALFFDRVWGLPSDRHKMIREYVPRTVAFFAGSYRELLFLHHQRMLQRMHMTALQLRHDYGSIPALGQLEVLHEQRMEGYSAALRKHGIVTAKGAVEAMLDPKFLLGASAVAGAFMLGHSVTGAAIAESLLFASRLGLSLAQRRIDLDDVKRGPNSEIAYVYEIAKATDDAKKDGEPEE